MKGRVHSVFMASMGVLYSVMTGGYRIGLAIVLALILASTGVSYALSGLCVCIRMSLGSSYAYISEGFCFEGGGAEKSSEIVWYSSGATMLEGGGGAEKLSGIVWYSSTVGGRTEDFGRSLSSMNSYS